jgi:sialidase-1
MSTVIVEGSGTSAAQPPHITRLYEAGQGGVHTYRIPAVVATTVGTLLVFCEARRSSRSDTGAIDLVVRRSCDNGASWQAMRVVAADGDSTCGNPCPIVVRQTGAVVMLFTKNRGNDKQDRIMRGEDPPRSVWRTVSRDDGVTWSEPVDISLQARKPDWRWYATGPCHGIQLASGRLVAPCDHSTGAEFGTMHSHVIYSDDLGATWRIGDGVDGYTDESTVVELSDGSLYLNMRNYRGTHRRAYSTSRDGGATWTPVVEDATLVEPVCQASVLRVSATAKGGRDRIAFTNPASTKRENLTLRLSYDECRSWAVSKALWSGPAAYSDLVLCPDGTIGCLFESGAKDPYEGIAFARVTLAWLTGGADRG